MDEYKINPKDNEPAYQALFKEALTTVPITPKRAIIKVNVDGLDPHLGKSNPEDYLEQCQKRNIIPFMRTTFTGYRHHSIEDKHLRHAIVPCVIDSESNYYDLPLEFSELATEIMHNGGRPNIRQYNLGERTWPIFEEKYLQRIVDSSDEIATVSAVFRNSGLGREKPIDFARMRSIECLGLSLTLNTQGNFDQKDHAKLEEWINRLYAKHHRE